MIIKVLDNVISEKYSQFIFDKTTNLSWTFVPNLSYGNKDSYDSSGFSYLFYLDKKYNQKENVTIETNEYNYVIPMILSSFDAFGLNASLNNVFRSRTRLTLPKKDSVIEDKHIDYSFPHLVLLYYINTTDGDTILYDNDKIVERISPKRGRCILFDGSIVHASSASTLSPRLVINTNIAFYE